MSEGFRTASYWEHRYSVGGNSGAGSYGHLALYKARFLNKFVAANWIRRVVELGCGDGAQLARAIYPSYIGYDISEKAIQICSERYKSDPAKSFFCLSNVKSLTPADLALSLDVTYHLVEDEIYIEYLRQIFKLSQRFVIIYGNGCVKPYGADHIRLRAFNDDIKNQFPDWSLIHAERNPFYSEIGTEPHYTWSNFYVYEAPGRAIHASLDRAFIAKYCAEGQKTINMPADDINKMPSDQWRDLIQKNPGGATIELNQSDLQHIDKTSTAFSGGYIGEILPEMRARYAEARPSTKYFELMTNPDVIVSLTTIKSRLCRLGDVLNSILRQTKLPDKVLLNISSEPHLLDDGIGRLDLTNDIIHMENSGLLEIHFVDNNGPFRKLLPTLRREWDSNCVIVTADDDTLYPDFWLEEMCLAAIRHPRKVISRRTVPMAIQDGKLLPYNDWAKMPPSKEIPAENQDLFILPTGKDGVLYRPSFFRESVFDPELIKMAPTCDDLVFKCMTMAAGIGVHTLSKRLSTSGSYGEYPIVDGGQNGLWIRHNIMGKNDESLTRLLDYLYRKNILDISSLLRSAQGGS